MKDKKEKRRALCLGRESLTHEADRSLHHPNGELAAEVAP